MGALEFTWITVSFIGCPLGNTYDGRKSRYNKENYKPRNLLNSP
jgi:hypothetical protein